MSVVPARARRRVEALVAEPGPGRGRHHADDAEDDREPDGGRELERVRERDLGAAGVPRRPDPQDRRERGRARHGSEVGPEHRREARARDGHHGQQARVEHGRCGRGPGGERGGELRGLPAAPREGGGGRRRGRQAAEHAGEEDAPARPGRLDGDVADERDRRDEQGHHPDVARVDRVERPQVGVGEQRHDQERDGDELERGALVLVGELPGEPVEGGLQPRQHEGDGPGDRRDLALARGRQGPEHVGEQEEDLRGQPHGGAVARRPHVRGDVERRDGQEPRDGQPGAGGPRHEHREPPQEGDDREGAGAGRAPGPPGRVGAFALHPEQEAERQGHAEVRVDGFDEGREGRHGPTG